MGNIEEKMANVKSIDEFSHQLKNVEDTRSDSEIEITNRLTYLLSDINSKRIMDFGQVPTKHLNWTGYVFLCFQGFPAPKEEFHSFDLPGDVVYFSSANFSYLSEDCDHATRMKYVKSATFKQEAEKIHEIFSKIHKNKKIVLVYHSAGNFILSMYFHFHGHDPRIVGMIDISGGPIHYYIAAQLLTPIILETDFKEIEDNADKVHKMLMKNVSKTGFDLGFKSKYETLSFLHYVKCEEYGEMFESTKNHPKILKLIIHGRNDTLFESKLLNEKAIYFTYKRKLDKNYHDKIEEKFNRLYKTDKKIENIQEKFIIAIPKGQHSVHTQPRNEAIIRNAIHQYLAIIHE